MLTAWLDDDLTTKHCGQKIRACHTVSLTAALCERSMLMRVATATAPHVHHVMEIILGILAALLFVSNVITIVYVNRHPILRLCRRMLGISYDDDDMRRSIINTD
ncbi:hypothetical protein ANCCAN_21357 [Ancylostoma caninum]|uniref:Uncharacterized protein n=1 Tax=Ancylostoma caninum TaxID=29170 RepID=A0A368FPT8_ANCCA|nr:hypothetical protein ANCCAN_21357 [Ancylostoma caninum]